MRRLGVLAAVLGVVVGSGCAPAPAVPVPPAEASGSAAAGVESGPRPREVRVDGLDPCELLTEVDRRELGLDQRPVLDVRPSGVYNRGVTPLCSIGGFEPRAISVGVELSVTGGVEVFFRPGVRSEIRPTRVADFPAIVAVPVLDRFCTVVVDVAPGQAVDVSASDGGRVPPIPQQVLCGDAQRVAELVLVNLLAQR